MLAAMVADDPVAEEVEDRGRAPSGWRRRQRIALVAGVPLVAVLAGLWVERRPIASHFIDGTLAASGVPARYRLTDLGPGRQRLADVVIGDPAHPDLVADWIETEMGVGLRGPELTGVRAGRVRVRGRLVDGQLSLGAIDRLLPAASGKPSGLPALALDVADARLRLETPAGVVGVGLSGRGRLDDGFQGRAALVGGALAGGGCMLAGARGSLRVVTRRGVVRLAGPVDADRLVCGATRLARPGVTLDAGFDPAASRWQGRAAVRSGALADPRGRAASVGGSVRFDGTSAGATGWLGIAATGVSARGASAGQLSVVGDYAIGQQSRFHGTLGVSRASVDRAAILHLRRRGAVAAGMPVGPLIAHAVDAVGTAARSFAGSMSVGLVHTAARTDATVSRAAVASQSGAVASFEGTATLAGAIDGALRVTGGGLPDLTATLRRVAAVSPITGVLTMRPYTAVGAALALAPARFSLARGGEGRIDTVATLSGPLGSGRVEGLVMPLALRRDARGVTVDPVCAPVSFRRLAIGGLRLDPARATLCPIGAALVRVASDGTFAGGARLEALRLGGQLGNSPLTIAARGAEVAIGTRGFAATGVTATLGGHDRPTRFAAETLAGAVTPGGVAGSFAGAGGQIGAVPLLLSDAAGRWAVTGGALDLGGDLTVSDATAAEPRSCPPTAAAVGPRFCPLRARDVALRLADGRIAATGTLTEPTTGIRVAGLAIGHDLASGAGTADLAIDKLSFAKGFQPDLLTPLTKGVIAEVAGTIDGTGHIAWSDAGVTSSGRFATAGTDLAAAFGPVTGIAGSIAFTDLLGLVSAPGQQLTVASINPGIPVENGVIRFHTEAGARVAVESARWPFAGGILTLDPTLLDFAAPAERHLTFHLDGIAADRFLQQFEFQNLAATGTFDGVLPMVFDASGGRVAGGRLTVREGGGGLAYVGDLSQKDLGFWGDLAFQALKSLRYRSLSIAMNGPLEGEMITEVRFAGVSQGQGAKSNFLVRRLQRLPFVFNVRIRAPFRELVQTTNSFSDPSDLLRRNLPALLAPVQAPPVQATSSGDVSEEKRP